jgi:hypothetical protein
MVTAITVQCSDFVVSSEFCPFLQSNLSATTWIKNSQRRPYLIVWTHDKCCQLILCAFYIAFALLLKDDEELDKYKNNQCTNDVVPR